MVFTPLSISAANRISDRLPDDATIVQPKRSQAATIHATRIHARDIVLPVVAEHRPMAEHQGIALPADR